MNIYKIVNIYANFIIVLLFFTVLAVLNKHFGGV